MGIPESERTVPKAPIGAWALMTLGIVAPAAVIAMVISTSVGLLERSLERMHERVATKGQRQPVVMTKGGPYRRPAFERRPRR